MSEEEKNKIKIVQKNTFRSYIHKGKILFNLFFVFKVYIKMRK